MEVCVGCVLLGVESLSNVANVAAQNGSARKLPRHLFLNSLSNKLHYMPHIVHPGASLELCAGCVLLNVVNLARITQMAQMLWRKSCMASTFIWEVLCFIQMFQGRHLYTLLYAARYVAGRGRYRTHSNPAFAELLNNTFAQETQQNQNVTKVASCRSRQLFSQWNLRVRESFLAQYSDCA